MLPDPGELHELRKKARRGRTFSVKLVISIDVEEEGLFSGHYAQDAPVTNVSWLRGLEFVSAEYGLPLTLLADYLVYADQEASETLRSWEQNYGAELGAHLHHWTTPPFKPLPYPEPIPCRSLPEDLLRNKLESLAAQMEAAVGHRPKSFRMGRFDFAPALESLLPACGISVDSSLVPLRAMPNGPDHFLVPPDPHALNPKLLETPVTMVPLFRNAPWMVYAFSRSLPLKARFQVLKFFRLTCALGIHPLWHPASTMRRAVRLHHARGGQVLNMFLHSSELMPGGCPKIRTEEDSRQLLQKIRSFLEWLLESYDVQGITLSATKNLKHS